MIIHDEDAFREPPKCVLFDLDNTLYDYDPCNEAGLDVARELAFSQLNIPAARFDACFDRARKETKLTLGNAAASHNRLLYFQRTLEIAGFASSPQVTLQLEQGYWRAYLTRAALFDHVLEFIDDLRMAKVPMAIVTDLTAQIQMRKMVCLRLNENIDWIVTSEETGADKPEPEIFRAALRKVGISTAPIWMVGDNLRCDMAGARAAIDAVAIQKVHGHIRPASSAVEAHAVFSSFADVRKLFARLVAAHGGT